MINPEAQQPYPNNGNVNMHFKQCLFLMPNKNDQADQMIPRPGQF